MDSLRKKIHLSKIFGKYYFFSPTIIARFDFEDKDGSIVFSITGNVNRHEIEPTFVVNIIYC